MTDWAISRSTKSLYRHSRESGNPDHFARRRKEDVPAVASPAFASLRAKQQSGVPAFAGMTRKRTSSGRTEKERQLNQLLVFPPPIPIVSTVGGAQIIAGTVSAAGRLDKALADASGLSRERIKSLIAQGFVELGGVRVAAPSGKAQAGMSFSIHLPPPAEAQASPQAIPLVIPYEDKHLIVVEKPAGLVVHPAAGNPDGTLVNALLHHCAGQLSGIGGVARPGIVHRIDKDTSGLLVVAKSDAAHEGLAQQFADHSIERVYRAVVAGHPRPAEGTVVGRIGRSDRNRKKMAVLPPAASRGKHAVTYYKVLKTLNDCALVECRLETGRTHQVRVHMASIGHPLLGDPVYGKTPASLRPLLKSLGFSRQALHAAVLGFIHPITGEKMRFASALPPDMEELIDQTAR